MDICTDSSSSYGQKAFHQRVRFGISQTSICWPWTWKLYCDTQKLHQHNLPSYNIHSAYWGSVSSHVVGVALMMLSTSHVNVFKLNRRRDGEEKDEKVHSVIVEEHNFQLIKSKTIYGENDKRFKNFECLWIELKLVDRYSKKLFKVIKTMATCLKISKPCFKYVNISHDLKPVICVFKDRKNLIKLQLFFTFNWILLNSKNDSNFK